MKTIENAIEAQGLRKTYPGEVRALDGLGFAVEAGTIFALLGPNGAGKSTLVVSRTGLLALLTLVCGWVATRAFHAYQRSV